MQHARHARSPSRREPKRRVDAPLAGWPPAAEAQIRWLRTGGASLGAWSSSAMATCAGRSPDAAQATGSTGSASSSEAAHGPRPNELGRASTPQCSCSWSACWPATSCGPLERASDCADGVGAGPASCSSSPCAAQMRCATSAKCRAGSTCPIPSKANRTTDTAAARSPAARAAGRPRPRAVEPRRTVCTGFTVGEPSVAGKRRPLAPSRAVPRASDSPFRGRWPPRGSRMARDRCSLPAG